MKGLGSKKVGLGVTAMRGGQWVQVDKERKTKGLFRTKDTASFLICPEDSN